MRVRLATPVALLALCALAGPARSQGVEVPAAPPSVRETDASNRVIVEWEDGVGAARRADARTDADTTLVRALGDPAFQLVRTEPGQSAQDAAEELTRDPAVRHAVPDSMRSLDAVPDDLLFPQLWALRNLGAAPGLAGFRAPLAGADIDVLPAWEKTVGTPSTVVADIDSGYRFEHPDLKTVAWKNPGETPGNGVDDDRNGRVDDDRGWDFVGANADITSDDNDNDPTDDNLVDGGHGVHTAGTIGARGNDGIGITGVAQDIRIMPLRVCSNSPSGGGTCATSSIIAAVNYAGIMGARVANLSLGGVDNYNAVELEAFRKYPETLFVISAGNDATDNDAPGKGHFPCNYGAPSTGNLANIVCVAATDQADDLAGFSDYGAQSVDLGAPGTEIVSTFPGSTPFAEDFEAGDFAARWTATGAAGGFTRSGTAPLTSFGITNAGQAAGTTVQSTSADVSVPAGGGGENCVAFSRRKLTTTSGGGTFSYDVLVNGAVVKTLTRSTTDTTYASRSLALGRGLAPGDKVRFRFTYAAGGGTPGTVVVDDAKVECQAPVGAGVGYRMMEGTSMAAPQVTGAAALLFSLKPAATVAQVRSALLSSVDPVPALAGRTTTGGRLDVGAATTALETALAPAPTPAATSTSATEPAQQSGAAASEPTVTATSAGAAAPARPTVTAASGKPVAVPAGCRVPALSGLSLAKAKTLLKHAGCTLGKVKRPKARKGKPAPALVVATASPKAGKTLPGATKVAVTLKAKPKKKAKRKG